MAITNRDRVGKALEILGDGLSSFVERELRAVLANKWQEAFSEGGPKAPAGKRSMQAKLNDPQLF